MTDQDAEPSPDADQSDEYEGKYDEYVDKILDLISLFW